MFLIKNHNITQGKGENKIWDRIKIANHPILNYLKAESEEEFKSLLMRVKEKGKKKQA